MPDPRDELSRRELEKQIEDLKRDKARIEDNIRRMEANQKRIFDRIAEDGTRHKARGYGEEPGPEFAGPLPPVQPASTIETSSRKRERSASTKRCEEKPSAAEDENDENGMSKEKEDEEKADDRERASAEQPDAEKADADKEAKERRRRERDKEERPSKNDPRSRNMFGKLLGHLHSAKNRLESEKGWKTTELNQKAQERIQEKLSLSKMNIQEFRRSQFEAQKKEEEAKAKEIERAIEEKELLLLQRRLEAHYSLMMNFIRTKAEPTIFYLPAKHTKDTEQMLEETREAIKHKIASLKVQLQPMPPEVEEIEATPEEEALRASAAAVAVAAADGAEETVLAAEGSVEEADARPTEEVVAAADAESRECAEVVAPEAAKEKEADKSDEAASKGCEDEPNVKETAEDKQEEQPPEEKKAAEPEKKKRKIGKQKASNDAKEAVPVQPVSKDTAAEPAAEPVDGSSSRASGKKRKPDKDGEGTGGGGSESDSQ